MDLFTAKDIKKLKKENPNVIDYEDYMKSDAINIPDIDSLINEINKILEFINLDENIKLSRKELEQKTLMAFPVFATNYFTLLSLLLDNGDLNMLFGMLDMLKLVKTNNVDIKDAEKKYGAMLAKKFIPPEILNDPKVKEHLNGK